MTSILLSKNAVFGLSDATVRAFRASDPTGFDILAFADKIGTRVCFGGLEHDFDTDEEAQIWIARARSSHYRLRIDLLANRPFRWALEEILPSGDVNEVLVSGREIPDTQKNRHRVIYQQNGTRE